MASISVEKRDELGRKSRQLRAKGFTPAVVYNSKGDSQAVKVASGTAIKLLREVNTASVIDLDIEGKHIKALLKEVDFNPVLGNVNHLGFFEIDENAVMVFDIPVVLEGVSPAVKNNLGILVQPTQTVEVKCKLQDLIEKIVVDVTKLDQVGQTITLADITLPNGMELLHKEQTDRSLASVTGLQKSLEAELEEAKAAEAAVAGNVDEAAAEEGAAQ